MTEVGVEFLVQGSAELPYQVAFLKTDNNLSAYCTCPAGENGQYCKHRLRILEGSADAIVSDNGDKVALVVSWLSGSDVAAAMADVVTPSANSIWPRKPSATPRRGS